MFDTSISWIGSACVILGTFAVPYDAPLASSCLLSGAVVYSVWSYRKREWGVFCLNLFLAVVNVGNLV